MQAWVIGNWKQNPATISDVNTLIEALLAAVGDDKADNDKDSAFDRSNGCQLMVAPSCIHLAAVSERLKDTPILTAAQDISAHSDSIGAYTGDCSAQQVADAGASWSILGHSERRQYHQECNDLLVQKLSNALTQDLGVIFCVGETQAQYDEQQTLEVLDAQLEAIKTLLDEQAHLATSIAKHLIVAYEPVWAIGTGKVPTVEEVSATHQHIKHTLAGYAETLSQTAVLYGGSVNADNADSFAASPVIDGALVGGASLKADSFLAIADAFGRAKKSG